jgi:hypothetical protein
MVVSGRRTGRCRALHWVPSERRYLCGLVSDPKAVLPALPAWAAPAVSRLARRWISSASGCDASLVAEPVASAREA